eukprot:750461-Hanusia_phi.AAC.2
MGLFDGLFGGNKSPPPPSQPAVPSERLQPIKGKTIVTFMPSNQQVYGRPGAEICFRVGGSGRMHSPCLSKASALEMLHREPASMFREHGKRADVHPLTGPPRYGCREGVCGTCEAKMRQPTGQINDVRICRDIVPKTNLDSPDR